MKDLTKTASILDKLLHIVAVGITIAIVAVFVLMGIVLYYELFQPPIETIGTNWEIAELGPMTLTIGDGYVPELRTILRHTALSAALSVLTLFLARRMVLCLRSILAPMKTGAPFRNSVSGDLRKLAKYTCIIGVLVNLEDILGNVLMEKVYNLSSLLLSDKITHVTITNVFDLSFLFVAGILLLLSYVFQYGEELQQLSDETL